MQVNSESEVAQSLVTPWTAAHQAPPAMGFSRQEYWSGVPLPSPLGYLYDILISATTLCWHFFQDFINQLVKVIFPYLYH